MFGECLEQNKVFECSDRMNTGLFDWAVTPLFPNSRFPELPSNQEKNTDSWYLYSFGADIPIRFTPDSFPAQLRCDCDVFPGTVAAATPRCG